MAARERRAQPSSAQEQPDRPDLPLDIDKAQLKKAFDISHFDLNAILRGIELTLVGGRLSNHPSLYLSRPFSLGLVH